MDRRTFLKLGAIGLAGLGVGSLTGFGGQGGNLFAGVASGEDSPLYCGWVDSPAARRRFIQSRNRPFLNQVNDKIRGTGDGKTVLLWQYLEKAYGHEFIPHNQAIGDCVSHSYGLGVDILTAIQMANALVPQVWVSDAATEIIYGGARVQSAGGKYMGDGCNGTDAADFISKYGILLRQKYLGGKFDYRVYSGEVATNLGRLGVPAALLPLCLLHPVKTVTLVRSWEECRDVVANGYPVTMCSNVGFSTRRGRDKDGFLTPGRQPWNHAMLVAGIDDNKKRPGGLIINSWGTDWVSGPLRNQPAGSFWADASVIDRAMKQGDSIALSNYQGYPLQNLDYQIF